MSARPWLRRTLSSVSLGLMILLAGGSKSEAADGKEPIQLFNGRDLDNWYVYTTETKQENPGVFQVVDHMIYVPGGKGGTAYYGGLITRADYANYRLRFEYKWGSKTFGERKDKARDAGILLHCVGPNGPRPWMTSYEFQIIEGGTGDLLVVNTRAPDDETTPLVACMAESEKRGNEYVFQPGAELLRFDSGRVNWWGRDPDWVDRVSFRGRKDVESPLGEWTKCEILAHKNSLEYYVNGVLVNKATNLTNTHGKIFLQTEGAELWYRNIELIPLD